MFASRTTLLMKNQVLTIKLHVTYTYRKICTTWQWSTPNLLLRNSITESITSFISLVYILRSSSVTSNFVVALNSSESFLSSRSGTPNAYQRHNKAINPINYNLLMPMAYEVCKIRVNIWLQYACDLNRLNIVYTCP